MDILTKEGSVSICGILGHGGLFKTPVVGQKIVAAAMNVSVSVMETASEGGAWGMAILDYYMKEKSENESLEDHLDKIVFKDVDCKEIYPDRLDVEGFEEFIERYKKGLVIEETAVNHLILSEQEE